MFKWIGLNKDDIVREAFVIVYDMGKVTVRLSTNVTYSQHIQVWDPDWISFIVNDYTFT
jgi:hypothetical protein